MAQLDLLASDGVEFESERAGLLLLARSRAVLAAERGTLDELGYGPYLELSPRQVRGREPALTGKLAGGIDVLPERHVRPESMCAGVAAFLRGRGAQLLEGFHAARLEGDGRIVAAVVADDDRDVGADAFIIATGAEAAALAKQSGARLPLQAGKGYSITIEQSRLRFGTPLHFAEARIGLTPFEGAHRVAGTMELSGINSSLDPRRLSALARNAEREIPGVLDGEKREDWVGMRPLTPDGLPLIGRLPTRDNVYVATGHQMLGVTLAASTGDALAQLVLGGSSETDLRPFDPARFSG
jgi:D-amino-acid dehydrogenase